MGRGLHCEFGFEPVNLNTGNFYLNRTDVSIPDYTDDFVIERNYNSKGAGLSSVFGRGWSFEYTEQITKDKDEIYTIAVGMEAFWSLLKKMGNIQHQMVMN